MNTETKSYADSFRIRNYENQLASVWQIGNGDFFAVKFDEDVEPLIYTSGDVSNAFRNGWIIVGEGPMKEESLPRTFKFKHKDHALIYTYKETQGANNIFWVDSYPDSTHYTVESIRKLISEGTWIVLPSENKIDTLQLKIEIDGINEAQDILDEMIVQSNTILERIKSATNNYDMTISIDGGCYHIYDNTCDIAYKADTDEKLLEVLNAIDFLCGCVE